MGITSKVKQSIILAADGQVQSLVAGSAANITKCNIMTIYGQGSAADAEIKLYNEIGDGKTASALIFHGKFGTAANNVHCLLYKTITSVVASGALTGAITVGYSYIGVASQAIYQLKTKYNSYTNGETPATSNKNLANNINIPARSRIVNWRVHILSLIHI